MFCRVAAVLLACCSAILFGGMTVALRYALRRCPDAELGALATTTVAFVACSLIAAADSGGSLAPGQLWPFALAGLLAPGAAQLLFTRAVREAGPSRTSVAVGVAPLVSVMIAILLLDEPLHVALAVGALLIVLGGVALIGERIRPDQFRRVGLALAFAATALFATRDNIVRWLSGSTKLTPIAAAATALLAGSLLLALYLVATRGRQAFAGIADTLAAFGIGGTLFGLSYAALFEAYYRGRVTVVSPLVATESLWGVLLSALIIGRSELIGKRLVLGAALIVAGGALIGAFR
jgi:drug/metabolite transporter (DMT)-like permease